MPKDKSLRIRTNNNIKILMMLVNLEHLPLVAMDWFPPNAKKELLIVPQEAKMMIVNMEMYAPHENWNLKNPFPGERNITLF